MNEKVKGANRLNWFKTEEEQGHVKEPNQLSWFDWLNWFRTEEEKAKGEANPEPFGIRVVDLKLLRI